MKRIAIVLGLTLVSTIAASQDMLLKSVVYNSENHNINGKFKNLTNLYHRL